MRRVFTGLAVFFLIICAGCAKKEKAAITIGPTDITAEEFQDAYQKARDIRGNEFTRKEFLDILIKRKLILQEAETLGLDKDPQMLDGLQRFWEQALTRLVLSRKINELSTSCKVSEKEIYNYYQRHKDRDFQGKELSEVHDSIKLLVYRIKEQLEVQRWMAWLKKKANVSVDYDALQIPKDK
jgi:hypothetical protein